MISLSQLFAVAAYDSRRRESHGERRPREKPLHHVRAVPRSDWVPLGKRGGIVRVGIPNRIRKRFSMAER